MSKSLDEVLSIVRSAAPTVHEEAFLSEQARAVIGLCMQKVLFEKCNLHDLLSGLVFFCDGEGELFITNPPDSLKIDFEALSLADDNEEEDKEEQ